MSVINLQTAINNINTKPILDETNILKMHFDDDMMKYFLLNILIHDYLHDLSPKTACGYKRCNELLTKLIPPPGEHFTTSSSSTRGGGNESLIDESQETDNEMDTRYSQSQPSQSLYPPSPYPQSPYPQSPETQNSYPPSPYPQSPNQDMKVLPTIYEVSNESTTDQVSPSVESKVNSNITNEILIETDEDFEVETVVNQILYIILGYTQLDLNNYILEEDEEEIRKNVNEEIGTDIIMAVNYFLDDIIAILITCQPQKGGTDPEDWVNNPRQAQIPVPQFPQKDSNSILSDFGVETNDQLYINMIYLYSIIYDFGNYLLNEINKTDSSPLNIFIDAGHNTFLKSLFKSIKKLEINGKIEKDLQPFSSVLVGNGPKRQREEGEYKEEENPKKAKVGEVEENVGEAKTEETKIDETKEGEAQYIQDNANEGDESISNNEEQNLTSNNEQNSQGVSPDKCKEFMTKLDELKETNFLNIFKQGIMEDKVDIKKDINDEANKIFDSFKSIISFDMPNIDKINELPENIKDRFKERRTEEYIKEVETAIINTLKKIYKNKQCNKILQEEKRERKIEDSNIKLESTSKMVKSDKENLWLVSEIYARTGLLSLDLCDNYGNPKSVTSNQSSIGKNILKLETQILRNLGWKNRSKERNIYRGIVDGDIDTQLGDGIQTILLEDSSLADRVLTNGKLSTDIFNPSIKNTYSFMDNALNSHKPFDADLWPKGLCTVAGLMDAWAGNGCTLHEKDTLDKLNVGMEFGQFAFKLTNQDESLYYQSIIEPRGNKTGDINIRLETGFYVNRNQFRKDNTSTQLRKDNTSTSIFDKKTLSAKNVLEQQLQLLVNSYNEYISMFISSNLEIYKFNLWEHFRTDTTPENKMLNLMQIGCVKAFGDLFQEILGNAAQISVYRGNKPYQITGNTKYGFTNFYNADNSVFTGNFTPNIIPLGRDRPLIQAGTDRPSAIGRACLFSALGQENEVNNMVLTGYSTSPDNYFYIRPRKLVSQEQQKAVKPNKTKPVKSKKYNKQTNSNIQSRKGKKGGKRTLKKKKIQKNKTIKFKESQ
jgi:hypothetical protein